MSDLYRCSQCGEYHDIDDLIDDEFCPECEGTCTQVVIVGSDDGVYELPEDLESHLDEAEDGDEWKH